MLLSYCLGIVQPFNAAFADNTIPAVDCLRDPAISFHTKFTLCFLCPEIRLPNCLNQLLTRCF